MPLDLLHRTVWRPLLNLVPKNKPGGSIVALLYRNWKRGLGMQITVPSDNEEREEDMPPLVNKRSHHNATT